MENPIKIYVPVSVTYQALEGVLKKQMVGEFIPKPEEGEMSSPYAQILDVDLRSDRAGVYDLEIRLSIRILRTVLKRDQADLQVFANIGYDNAAQHLFVQDFRMNSKTSSGFFNTALEVLVNKVAYNQIIRKSSVNLNDIISKELTKINNSLDKGLELKGIKLMGAVKEVRVNDITPLPDKVTLSIEVQGELEAAVYDLITLMPVD